MRRRRSSLKRTVGYLVAIAALFVACRAMPPDSTAPDAGPAPVSSSREGNAALQRLTVASAGPLIGYSRDAFGQPWKDTDGNGCDQRSDVLIRDAAAVSRDPGHPCKVITITLVDPYTGKRLDSTTKIQIDHVVPLAAAWRAGAQLWNAARREQFATDEANLLAVDGPTNESKGDKTPDAWKPPNHGIWCRYATVYAVVSDKYRLSITAVAKSALNSMLATCKG